MLGTLGSVLPALETLHLCEPAAGSEGERQLAWRRGWARGHAAGCGLPLYGRYARGRRTGASALAAALGQGALPRLKILELYAGLAAAARAGGSRS